MGIRKPIFPLNPTSCRGEKNRSKFITHSFQSKSHAAHRQRECLGGVQKDPQRRPESHLQASDTSKKLQLHQPEQRHQPVRCMGRQGRTGQREGQPRWRPQVRGPTSEPVRGKFELVQKKETREHHEPAPCQEVSKGRLDASSPPCHLTDKQHRER